MTIESFEQRSALRKAVDDARRYRDAEQRINDQIRSIENQAVSEANKKELRRLRVLSSQKRTRATQKEALAKELGA